jgi:hypothetical protein
MILNVNKGYTQIYQEYNNQSFIFLKNPKYTNTWSHFLHDVQCYNDVPIP